MSVRLRRSLAAAGTIVLIGLGAPAQADSEVTVHATVERGPAGTLPSTGGPDVWWLAGGAGAVAAGAVLLLTRPRRSPGTGGTSVAG